MTAILNDADEHAVTSALADATCLVPDTHGDHPGILRALKIMRGERPDGGYPACEKLARVAPLSQEIGGFLDWLNEQCIYLAEYETRRECTSESWETVGPNCEPRWKCVDGTIIFHPLVGLESHSHDMCDGTGFFEPENAQLLTRSEPYEQLLARFFEIDLDAVETERRAMLDELRKANARG